MLDAIFNRFVQDSPVTVMARALMEKVFAGEHLNKLFERLAEKQYHQEILFSSLVGLMSLVVCGIHKSVNAAYKAKAEDIRVSIRSIYNKLQRVEPQVSRGLVSQTAKQLKEIIEELGAQQQKLLPELPECEVRMLDGTSLGGTDHRLEVLREEAATPLPGKALVVYEPKIDLVSEVFPCEDGHAQERSLLRDVLETVTAFPSVGRGPQLLYPRLFSGDSGAGSLLCDS